MALFLRVLAGMEAVIRLFGWIAAWLCVVLVLLVAGDVFARYFFRVGAVWLQELQWHLISPIALFGMSYALYCGDQVRVDVLYERYPPRVQKMVEVATGCLMIGIGLYFAWLALPWLEQSWNRREGSPNPGGMPGRFVLKALLPLGFLLLAIQGFVHAARNLISLSEGSRA